MSNMIKSAVIDFKSNDKLGLVTPNNYKSSHLKTTVVVSGATLILISSLIISVCAILKLGNIQEEVKHLRWEIDQFKSAGVVDPELIEDIRKFEFEEYPDDSDDVHIQSLPVNEDDLFDSDYDINYDSDENNFEMTINNDETNFSSVDHEDVSNMINRENLTKVGRETDRRKRETTQDGIPIIAEPYYVVKRRNMTGRRRHSHKIQLHNRGESSSTEHSYQSSSETFAPAPLVLSRKSRVMHAEETAKPIKRIRKPRMKSTSGEQWEPIGEDTNTSQTRNDHPEHRRRNRHKQRNNIETFDEKPRGSRTHGFPAIQFVGDTSKYIMGQHTNYNGNGHLQHTNPTYVDWVANDWVKSTNMDQYFQIVNGNLKIKQNGLYFVYAQIYYLDEHDTNGYRVHKNNEVILQCTTMTHSVERVIKGNTCYTAGLSVLNEGDEVSIQDLGAGRYSIFEPGKSFFGVIKLADVKVK